MDLNQRDRTLHKLQAGWNRPMNDDMLALFSDRLTPLDYDRCVRAVNMLIDTKKNRPVWSEFRECHDACRDTNARVIAPPDCGICDNGWVDVTPANLKGFIGTVTPCPNGCKPMTHDQFVQKQRRDDEQWVRDHPKDKQRVDDLIGQAAAATQRMDSRYDRDIIDDTPF